MGRGVGATILLWLFTPRPDDAEATSRGPGEAEAGAEVGKIPARFFKDLPEETPPNFPVPLEYTST